MLALFQEVEYLDPSIHCVVVLVCGEQLSVVSLALVVHHPIPGDVPVEAGRAKGAGRGGGG